MRPQKVSVDVWKMIFSTCSYLALAFVAWVFLKLVNACFWLPSHLRERDRLKEEEEAAQALLDKKGEEPSTSSEPAEVPVEEKKNV